MFKQTRARIGDNRASLYIEITNKIIAELEAGCVPWVQPWGRRRSRRRFLCRTMPRYGALQVLEQIWSA